MRDDDELLAELTDGHHTTVEPITEELVLGSSWLFMTRDGQDDWHRVVKVEPLRDRRDGARLRVTLEHPRRFS